MAINKKGVFETLQHKISNIDSNSSTSVIIDTLKAVKKADHNTIVSYADSSGLPTASASNYRLAYINDVGQLRFNNGLQWDKLQTQLPSKAAAGYSFQGTVSGYALGGTITPYSNVIQKYSFTSDGNGTDVANLITSREDLTASTSATHGYAAGGRYPTKNEIEKFAFATEADATDVGDLFEGTQRAAAASSETHGYAAGGETPGNATKDNIQKYSHSTDGNSTDVANLLSPRMGGGGNTSATHGYHSGGSSPTTNVIQKYSFASDADATDVGDLTNNDYEYAENGASSTTNGYVFGGGDAHIEKFPFATDTNATNIGNLSPVVVTKPGGSSSTTFGYSHGGAPSANNGNRITKFPYAVEEGGTDVGDLAVVAMKTAGTQV